MRAVESLIICTLLGSFCRKYISFRKKNTEDLCLMKLNSNVKFEEKLTLASKNDMRNFNLSSGKFAKNLQFDVLL